MTTLASVGRRLGIDAAGAALALRMAVAATLAFAIAAALHVHNAYWAAMPVWVVAQNARGLLIERGFFRIVGTLIGAAAGFAILRAVPGPYAALALLGLWVAGGAAAAALLRGVVSYAALMAGMTAAVVVLPSVLAPERLLPLAVARVECTLIGVVVVTLVTGFFTPSARRREFYQRVRQLAADAAGFAAEAAGGRPARDTAALERRVLTEMVEVDTAARTVAAGSVEGYRRLRYTTALVAASIALMAAAAALRARRLRGEPVPDALAGQLASQAALLREAAPWEPAPLDPAQLPGGATTPEERVHRAMAWLVAAEQALFAQRVDTAAEERGFAPRASAYLTPHRDWHRAASNAVAAGLGTFAAAAVGLASGWPAAELAALGVCIFSMVLGTLPAPRAVAPKLIAGVAAGVVAATFYRFVVQPHVAGPASLVLSIVPFIVVGALARVSRHTAMPALDANMCFMLGSQAGMPAAGGPEILNGAAALMTGAVLVGSAFLLAPDRSATRSQALAGHIRRDVARLFDNPRTRAAAVAGEWHARTARRILRLLLDLQRAGRSGEAPEGLLAALNLGHAVTALQDALDACGGSDPQRAALETVLHALQAFDRDPEGAGAAALQAGAAVHDPALRQVVHDAADALREGAALWRPTA